MNDVIRVYDARDADGAGAGLGVISPTECEVTEAAGGDYVLTAAIPIADGTGWELALLDRQVVATVPVGAARKRQRFRIHATTVQDGGLTIAIQARHITYDLSYYVLHQEEETTEKISAREAGEKLWNAIEGGAGAFALHVEMDRQLRISWGRINVIRALLDQTGGFVRKARARLLRDNQDIYLLPSDVLDSGLIIRRDVNLTALSVDRDTTETYTRLIPTGQDTNGDVIYLPEKNVDAPEIDEYAMPRVYTWAVSGARVGQERTRDDGTKEALTLEQVYDLLRDAAQEKLDAGVGAPEQSGTVEYIDLSRTEQFATLFRLQDAFLYAQITVENALTGFRLKKQVSGYTWDVLGQRYTQLKLGDPWTDGGKDSFVTSSQHDSAMQALTISQEQFDAMLKRHAVAVEDNKQKTSGTQYPECNVMCNSGGFAISTEQMGLTLYDNGYHTFVITKNDGDYTFYLDNNKLYNDKLGYPQAGNGDDPLYIGGWGSGWGMVKGTIMDVRIYNQCIDDAAVDALNNIFAEV